MLKSLMQRLFSFEQKNNSSKKEIVKSDVIKNYEKKDDNGHSNELINTESEQKDIESLYIPDLGTDKQTDFIISKWFVKTGDIVSKGTIICELETNKITMEFENYFNGKILLSCKEREKLKTGMEICKIQKI